MVSRRSTIRRIATLLALAAPAALLLVPAVASAWTWSLPAPALSPPPGNAESPQVAVASDGTATAVWLHIAGSGETWIMAATRLPGQAAFGAPQRISFASAPDHPRIAVAPDGTTVVVWRDMGTERVEAAIRPAGQASFPDPSVTAPQALSTEPAEAVLQPGVAAAGDGSFTAVWRVDLPGSAGEKIQSATMLAGAGSFAVASDVATSASFAHAYPPEVAGAPDGTATAIWTLLDGTTATVQTATRPAGETSFPNPSSVAPQVLSATASEAPQLAIGEDGRVIAIWENTLFGRIDSATRATGATAFEAPVTVVEMVSSAAPQIAVVPGGEAIAVWMRSSGPIVSASRAPGASAWGTDEAISTPTGGYDELPRLAVAPDGRVVVVWQRRMGDGSTSIWSATRAGGTAAWAAEVQLDAASGQYVPRPGPMVAFAADGRATAIWKSDDTSGGSARTVARSASTDPTVYGVGVTVVGDGAGTVDSAPSGIACGAACSAGFALSSRVTLTARAAAGSTFTGWSGACSGTASTCTLTVLGDRAVTAAFAKDPVPLARLRVRASRMRNGRLVTTGAVPSGATRVEQTVVRLGPVASRGTRDPRRVATRTVRCPITTEDGKRSFRCRIALDPGRWRVTTTALAATAPVARSVRLVAVRRSTPEPVTG